MPLYINKKRNHTGQKIHLQAGKVSKKKNIKIWFNAKWGEINEPKGIAYNVSSDGHYGYGDYKIDIKNDNQSEYILSLVKESLVKNQL